MKTGRSLTDLAAEIERQAKTKKDYIADTRAISIWEPMKDTPIAMRVDGLDTCFPISDIAHDQIAEHVKIPKPYYDRMRREAPGLLKNNIEEWFGRYPAKRMIRTLDGNSRAFLSDKFQPLDNMDFAEATLPVLAKRKLQIQSCEITEKRIYIKAVDEALFRDVPVGYKMGDGSHQIFDTCAPAIILSNSEVGFGRIVVETGVYTRACTNLALWSDGGMKRTHVGARHKMLEGSNVEEVLSDKTKRKTQEVLWMQVRDVIEAAFNADTIGKRLDKLAATTSNKIEGKVEKVVEVAAERFGLNDGERESVLKYLIERGSLTQYGLHAAVTRSAQDVADYDRATNLEYFGGAIVDLTAGEWRQMAQAA